MINRIVKMTFKEKHIQDFKKYVTTIKPSIKNCTGCTYLDILQDVNNPIIFFTYSHWKSIEDLNNYRNSPLFSIVWPKTKQWFAANAEAWSTEVIA